MLFNKTKKSIFVLSLIFCIIELSYCAEIKDLSKTKRSTSGCNDCGDCSGKNCGGGGGKSTRGGGGGGGGSGGGSGGIGGLSLRELLMILPFLSPNQNAAPAPQAAPPPSPATDVAGGAIAQLAKVISRRQVDQYQNLPKSTATEDEMRKAPAVNHAALRKELQRLMAEEAKRMANVIVTPHPVFGRNLAVPTTTSTTPATTTTTTTQMPLADFVDDYHEVPTQPPVPTTIKLKMAPGEQCENDWDCVPGAACTRGSVARTMKYCICQYPMVGFDGQCVMPGSLNG